MGGGPRRAILSGSGMYRLEAIDQGGYKIAAVQGDPPEKGVLRAGVVILAIGGFPLFGLSGQDLEDAFARLLVDKAEVQTLEWAELQAAEAERDAGDEREDQGYVPREELSADGTLLVVPLGEGAVRRIGPEQLAELELDLGELAAAGVRAELRCPPTLGLDSVALRGDPDRVQEVRQDLQEILAHHGLSLPEGAPSASRACCEG